MKRVVLKIAAERSNRRASQLTCLLFAGQIAGGRLSVSLWGESNYLSNYSLYYTTLSRYTIRDTPLRGEDHGPDNSKQVSRIDRAG